MPITVTITAKVDDWWGTAEELAAVSDEALIEMLQEDVISLLHGATWEIARPAADIYAHHAKDCCIRAGYGICNCALRASMAPAEGV